MAPHRVAQCVASGQHVAPTPPLPPQIAPEHEPAPVARPPSSLALARRQEGYFQYLFGVNDCEDYYGACDLRMGRAILFIPRLPEQYAVWSGRILTPAAVPERGSAPSRHAHAAWHVCQCVWGGWAGAGAGAGVRGQAACSRAASPTPG